MRRIDSITSVIMVKNNKVPDAWDDDWESQADRLAREEEASSSDDKTAGAPVMKKSERLAKHAEEQRKLWEAACVRYSDKTGRLYVLTVFDSEQPPDELLFVATSSNVPLATG